MKLKAATDIYVEQLRTLVENEGEEVQKKLRYSAAIGRFYHACEFTISLSDPTERRSLTSLVFLADSLLMINSFGLQSALERSPIDLGHFFAKVFSAAMVSLNALLSFFALLLTSLSFQTVVAVARDELGPTGRLRHAPDSTFVMLSYAILSLLKVR